MGINSGSEPGFDFLAEMARQSQQRLLQAQAAFSEAELLNRSGSHAPPAPLHLSDPGFDVIAEIKKKSPSAGQLAGKELTPVDQAGSYLAGGAVALSVLTEPTAFSGSLEYLEQVSALNSPVPLMRKDFLVSGYQVLEARLAGASGVLLIAAMLDDETLSEMLRCALGLGMFVLMEAFDSRDIARCCVQIRQAGPVFEDGRCRMLLGLNCRDLRTLEVNFSRFAELAPELPDEIPCVAESGVASVEQAAAVSALGYRLALVGTSLMQSSQPADALQNLITAGRQAAGSR